MPLRTEVYSAIANAAVEMARCNGGINRYRTEKAFLYDLGLLLDHSPHDLPAINEWLKSRSDEQLLTIVDGEQSDQEAEMASAPAGADMLLNDIFDSVI